MYVLRAFHNGEMMRYYNIHTICRVEKIRTTTPAVRALIAVRGRIRAGDDGKGVDCPWKEGGRQGLERSEGGRVRAERGLGSCHTFVPPYTSVDAAEGKH